MRQLPEFASFISQTAHLMEYVYSILTELWIVSSFLSSLSHIRHGSIKWAWSEHGPICRRIKSHGRKSENTLKLLYVKLLEDLKTHQPYDTTQIHQLRYSSDIIPRLKHVRPKGNAARIFIIDSITIKSQIESPEEPTIKASREKGNTLSVLSPNLTHSHSQAAQHSQT